MSSGDANAPPTYYFTDITFNPSFYSTTTGDYLTATTGKNYFLSYPTAQGTETISTLKASSIDSSTTTTAFNFLSSQTANINIGNTTTGTSGQIIKIGPTATTAITVGDLSITSNTINNSTNSANRGVKIGDLQTAAGADLDLGAHISRLGDINIGTGNTTATPTINIGASTGTTRAGAIINVGTVTTNPINIGNASANLTISCASGSIKTNAFACTTQTASGLITANGGITCAGLSSNSGITISGTPSTINTSGGSLTIGGASTTLIINSSTGQLWGATAFNLISANFTIPSTINRDYYLAVTLSPITITLPAVKINQIINIRNVSSGSLTIVAPTGSIYPNVSTGGAFTVWSAFTGNQAQHFYCDGTNWYGF